MSSWANKIKRWVALITVEPTMVLYMMAFMTTSIVEQAFFVDKACRINHNYTKEICDNLTASENKDFNKNVQITVSEFHQWNDIAGHIVPIILALFMGAWSDKRGRKLPMLIGLFGKFYYSSMIVLNTIQDWPVEYVIYTATLPMAFTGADVAIFAAAFTYLADISTQENRTLRVTILEVCYLATMPTGIALGSYLFSHVTNQSYTIMFIINASLLFASLVYTYARLKWRTSEKQRPLSEASNVFADFFDYNHVSQTIITLIKWRPKNRRTYLILLIITMGFYSFQRDEKQMSFMYFRLILNWTFQQISTFRTFQSALQDVVLLTAVPLMSTFLGFRDTCIVMIGAIAHAIARLFFANTETVWLIYIGGGFASFGPIVAPVIRSMVSKLVSAGERGKAFSLLSVTDNAIPLISGVAYSQVYKATIDTEPTTIFYVTITTQLLVLTMALYIHVRAKDNDLIHTEVNVEDALEYHDNNTQEK